LKGGKATIKLRRLFIPLKVIFLFTLVPALLFYTYGLNALIPVLIYFQLLLLWAQAELGMRQQALARYQSEPSFAVRMDHSGIYGASTIHTRILKLKNISDWPAYNVMLVRVLDETLLPVKPDEWKKWLHTDLIECLPPNEEEPLCSWTVWEAPKDLEGFTFEVSYSNRFGELRTLYTRFFRKNLREKFILRHEEPPRPGLFLRLLEDLGLLLRLRRFEKLVKRSRRSSAG